MREARIVLPLMQEDGTAADEAHAYLRGELLEEFGGYTSFRGEGGWRYVGKTFRKRKDYHEPVMIYDVAVDGSPTAVLRNIAFVAGELANQESVYLRLTNGEVELVQVAVERQLTV